MFAWLDAAVWKAVLALYDDGAHGGGRLSTKTLAAFIAQLQYHHTADLGGHNAWARARQVCDNMTFQRTYLFPHLAQERKKRSPLAQEGKNRSLSAPRPRFQIVFRGYFTRNFNKKTQCS